MHQSQETIIPCLDSITNQDFLDYEIILVDDDLSLVSENLVKEYMGNHPDIPIFYETVEDSGPDYKRNVGIRKSKGEYIWFIDSDDEIEKDSLSTAYRLIQDSACDILRFSYRTILNGQSTRSDFYFKEDIYEGDRLTYFVYDVLRNCWNYALTPWKHIYRKELINNIGFPTRRKGFQDVLFNCLVYPNAKRIQVTGDILYRYYIRSKSISHIKKHVLENTVDSYCDIREYYLNNHFWEIFKNAILSSYGDFFILGAGKRRFGAMYRELKYYDDFIEGVEEVRRILGSRNGQELLSDALNRKLPEELKRQYVLLKEGHPEELCKYLNSGPINNMWSNSFEDKIEFVKKLEISQVGNEIFATPLDTDDGSFLIKLDEESSKFLRHLLDTGSIHETLKMLFIDFPDEKKEEIAENLFDLIHRLKAQKIIR